MSLTLARTDSFHQCLHRFVPKMPVSHGDLGRTWDCSLKSACVRAEDDPMGFPGWMGVSRGQILGWYEHARREID